MGSCGQPPPQSPRKKKYAKKYPQKKLCKKYHQIIKKNPFLEVYLSTTFQENQKPNFELEALKIQHFFNMDSNFLREKKKCHILSDLVHDNFFSNEPLESFFKVLSLLNS